MAVNITKSLKSISSFGYATLTDGLSIKCMLLLHFLCKVHSYM